jgi:hypothetical protein
MSGLGCISLNMLDSENQKLSLSAFMPISCLHFVIATPGKQDEGPKSHQPRYCRWLMTSVGKMVTSPRSPFPT